MAEHIDAGNAHTRRIAEFVSSLTYERIPQAVRKCIKLLILDSLGCAIHGANLEWCRILRGALENVDATRTTSVWGTPARLSSPHAALINGTQVQGFELDDVHRRGVLHVGAVTLPALAAVTESHCSLSGREFLTAAVAGYEIGPRVGLCMGQEHIGQGWHSGATVGVYSAAAGAARGLRLPTQQTVHALGIAGTQAAGLMAAQYGATVKRMHAGRAAQSGLYGALLAKDGFTGIIRLRDGTIESEMREAPRGSERSFASTDQIVEKFSKLTRTAMTRKRQAALVDAVLNLERLADGKELIRLLRAGTRASGGSDGARTRDPRRDRPSPSSAV
jgi:aconitate decarboxylase